MCGVQGKVTNPSLISYRQVNCRTAVIPECQHVLVLRRLRQRELDNMVGLPICGGTDNDGANQFAGFGLVVIFHKSVMSR